MRAVGEARRRVKKPPQGASAAARAPSCADGQNSAVGAPAPAASFSALGSRSSHLRSTRSQFNVDIIFIGDDPRYHQF